METNNWQTIDHEEDMLDRWPRGVLLKFAQPNVLHTDTLAFYNP